jgi:MFS family permease
MFATYRAAFRAPGAVAFCAAAFVARFSIAVYPIGLVLLVSLRTGHYGFAGLLAGTYVFANGVGNPVLGRWADRFGQRRVLMPAAAVHLGAAAVVIALAEARAPDTALLAPTIVLGFSYIAIGSLVRARWSFVLAGRPELSTAYSLESTLDEVIFTLGPLAATLVATQLDPVPVFVAGALLVAVGSWWLARQGASEPPLHPAGAAGHASALRSRGMVLLLLASAGMGAFFACAEVTMIAFCGQHGHTALAGAVLACFAGGSGVAGFVYGARQRSVAMVDQFRLRCVIFAVLPVLLLVAGSVPVLAVVAFVVGTGIAPALTTAFALSEQIVPAAALTEGMSWLVATLSIGYGVAAAAVGRIADATGARPAFGLAIGAAASVGVLAVLLHRRLAAS